MNVMADVATLSLALFQHGDAHARRRFADELSASLRRYGFVVLAEHGIGHELLADAYRLAQELFDWDAARKVLHAGGLRGYTPFGREHAKDHTAPDLKEFWQIGRASAALPPNIWPQDWPQFAAVFRALYAALDQVGTEVLRALAPSLGLEEHWFRARVAHGNSILRIIHYPPVPAGVNPASIRAAAHEDINFVTVMVAARGAGLELLDGERGWLPVRADERQLIVNTGDMLARLTNDVIPAKTHRVVNPAGDNLSRYSMPFFVHPSDATSLACLPSCVGSGARYAPCTAGEFLSERLREIGLAG
jgi:isopenicillin N synthase-like dioxygenase